MKLNTTNPHEILDLLDAAYPIEKGDIYVGNPNDKMWAVPDRQSLYIDRPDGLVYLGESSRSWNPLQPIEFVKAMTEIASENGGKISNGISIKGGKALVLEIFLPNTSFRQYEDDYNVSLIGYLSNIPGEGLNFRLKTTRLVCQNGLSTRLSVGNAKILSHTGSLSEALKKVSVSLQMQLSQTRRVLEIAKNRVVTPEEAHKTFLNLFQTKEDREACRVPASVTLADRLFGGDLIGIETIGSNNGLAAINTVTQILTHNVNHRTLESAAVAEIFSHTDLVRKICSKYGKQKAETPVPVGVAGF